LQAEQLLENSARGAEHRTALIVEDHRMTYGDVDRQSNRMARALIGAGVKRGDRVVICMENSGEAVVSIFAVLKAGAVFVVVSPTARPERLRDIVRDCDAMAIAMQAPQFDSIQRYLREVSVKAIFVDGRMADPRIPGISGIQVSAIGEILHSTTIDPGPLPKRAIDIDLAALLYTSGSTGKPKGVMLTHLNIVSMATSIAAYLENTSDDIILSVLPISHGYGLYQILTAFKVGATVILERGFRYPAAVLDRMQREKVTGFPLIPAISSVLLRMDLAHWDLSTLRYITNAGEAFPLRHISSLRELLPTVRLYPMYGLTECQRVSYLPPEQVDIRPNSVGRGIPNQETFIVDGLGNRVGPGVTGELVVRGSNVMKGYWRMSEETDRVLKPGPSSWEKVLYTGDLFRMDEEGYLYFVGRKDYIFKCRGEKVNPREVEAVLYSLSGVAEVVVLGVTDEILGDAIKAIIVIEEGVGLTENDVLRHCADHLEDFMRPRRIEFRERLPRTANGKIARRELAETAEELEVL